MSFVLSHLPDVVMTLLSISALWFVIRQWHPGLWTRRLVFLFGAAGLSMGLLLRSARIYAMLPLAVADGLRLTAFLLLIVTLAAAGVAAVWRFIPRPKPHHSPERRKLLIATRSAVLAAPVVAAGYGVFVQRDNFRVREVDIHVPGLAPELNGLRLVQLSDIHLSPFLSEREFARAIDMANETRAHIAIVTGDLITGFRDPLDACIHQISRLRADAGIYGCLGNHEIYARAENYATHEAARLGIRFLRDQSEVLYFDGKPINLTGIDYQKMNSDYLRGAERHVRSGMPNILLSHNPDVFPVAAQKGFDVTLAGHTHGGQITFEILSQNVSIARVYTPFVYGLYREGPATAYVTRGIGTVGVPARLGAPPEVGLIRLCAI